MRIESIKQRTHSAGHLQVFNIACGAYHCLCITYKGVLLCWGAGSFGQVPANILSMIWIQLLRRFGQLGNGSTDDVYKPQPLMSAPSFSVGHLCCGPYHNMLTTAAADEIWSWGRGLNGQLGYSANIQLVPRKVTDLTTMNNNADLGWPRRVP